MRIVTFNVQNMKLTHQGDHDALRGARDDDAPESAASSTDRLDSIDRRLTAEIIHWSEADVVCLQEVYDRETLDHFHDECLVPSGTPPYPHRACLPGNDGRGFDVAIMSRRPFGELISHAELTPNDLGLSDSQGQDPDSRIFRRDCLLAAIGDITIYVCHFKAPYPDQDLAWSVRRLEALAVRRLIEDRFADSRSPYWLVVGDLNEHIDASQDHEPAIAPLTQDFGIDLAKRIPEGERWTYRDPQTNRYSSPDVLLASPALASSWPDAKPMIIRCGLDKEAHRYTGFRFFDVGYQRPHASDHVALAVDFPGI